MEIIKTCQTCHKRDAKMNKCSLCRSTYYCSPDCQRKDWNAHKETCDPVNALDSRCVRKITSNEEYRFHIGNIANQPLAKSQNKIVFVIYSKDTAIVYAQEFEKKTIDEIKKSEGFSEESVLVHIRAFEEGKEVGRAVTVVAPSNHLDSPEVLIPTSRNPLIIKY
jgi:hypothetical protein